MPPCAQRTRYLQIGDKKSLYGHVSFVKKTYSRATLAEEKPKKTEKRAKPQPIELMPTKKREEPGLPVMVIPLKGVIAEAYQKKTKKEKEKTIFSLDKLSSPAFFSQNVSFFPFFAKIEPEY